MAWSKNLLTYPVQLREIFIRVMETEQPSTHTFPTPREAAHFERMVQGVRYALSYDKESAYRHKAPTFTTEHITPTQIRICSVNDTERARIASIALAQRRRQDKANGVDMVDMAPLSPGVVE